MVSPKADPWRSCCPAYCPIGSRLSGSQPVLKNGGRNPIGVFPSVLAWTTDWSRRNQCEANPIDYTIAPGVTRREYTHCAGGAQVVLYTVKGGGHQWPGGKPMPEWLAGPSSNGVDATNQMWAFFRDHPLQQTQADAPQN